MALVTAPKVGVLVAATGVAHFAAPDFFEGVAKTAFPDDARTWVYRNGAAELALGLALIAKPTRKLGTLGLLGYMGFFVSRAAVNR